MCVAWAVASREPSSCVSQSRPKEFLATFFFSRKIGWGSCVACGLRPPAVLGLAIAGPGGVAAAGAGAAGLASLGPGVAAGGIMRRMLVVVGVQNPIFEIQNLAGFPAVVFFPPILG